MRMPNESFFSWQKFIQKKIVDRSTSMRYNAIVLLLILNNPFTIAQKNFSILSKMKLNELPQFTALKASASAFHSDDKLHLRNLIQDASRSAGLVATHKSGDSQIILDYSRQQVTGETMELLFDLADKVGFTSRRDQMRSGVKINSTEDRSVLHHALRMPKGYDYSVNPEGAEILKEVHEVRDKIEAFTNKVRSGAFVGATGKELKNFVCIGIGGSQLGPEFVNEAMRAYSKAAEASKGRNLRFLANVDPVDFELCTRDLDPEETLLVVISKTFTTAETMLNARTAKKWILDGLAAKGVTDTTAVTKKHVCAVSTAIDLCTEFGIDSENIFGFWNWVGGRFSVCSAVGVVPLSLQYSYDVVSEFLDGAHDIDEHFFNAPLRENIPVILGLLGVWNSTFLGYETRALLPYSQAMKRFPAHIQQVDMESNGKRVDIEGNPLPFQAGEINFGEPGTNGQHSFYQLMHQGRVVPADFIGFMESQAPVSLDGEPVSNHDELMSNFFAQPDALAYGKTLNELVDVPENLRQHKVFSGNRPSSSMLLTRLDAFSIGQLLAIYEHRTAVQGFIWNVNSFDQWGVELGKVLAKQVRSQLQSSRKSGAHVQGFNSSTTSLLEAYLSHGK
jgi:glucose-6-phosphate isomerase